MSRDRLAKAFGARVRKLREDQGISQERLAEMCGVHRNYIGAVERGRYNISLVNIGKIAAALRVGMSELFRGVPAYEGLRAEVLRQRRERERDYPR